MASHCLRRDRCCMSFDAVRSLSSAYSDTTGEGIGSIPSSLRRLDNLAAWRMCRLYVCMYVPKTDGSFNQPCRPAFARLHMHDYIYHLIFTGQIAQQLLPRLQEYGSVPFHPFSLLITGTSIVTLHQLEFVASRTRTLSNMTC